jgi:hypothetical protein
MASVGTDESSQSPVRGKVEITVTDAGGRGTRNLGTPQSTKRPTPTAPMSTRIDSSMRLKPQGSLVPFTGEQRR